MTNGNIPDLGALRHPQGSPRASTGMFALVARLDEQGTFEPEKVVQTPQGMQVVTHRSDYVDAEQLVEMIRAVVREELRLHRIVATELPEG